jgi:hypothetical protein
MERRGTERKGGKGIERNGKERRDGKERKE